MLSFFVLPNPNLFMITLNGKKKITSMASFGVHLFFVGELFAQAPVEQYPGCVVEAVTDSSRYFVIRIEDGNGKSLKQDFFYIHAFTWSLLKTDTSYKQSHFFVISTKNTRWLSLHYPLLCISYCPLFFIKDVMLLLVWVLPIVETRLTST